MSSLETILVEWFTIKEKLPPTGVVLLIQHKKDNKIYKVIYKDFLTKKNFRCQYFFLLEQEEENVDTLLIDQVMYWTFNIYPKGVD